jgi:ABC-type polysaccharide/polyol phosphate transport system ATPase subunit
MSDPSAAFPEALAIRLERVSIRYRMPTEPVRSLKEQAIRYVKGQRTQFRDFLGLKDLSLDVVQGEFLGIIGRNGAGKSTLLKVISRILKPTSGRVCIRGQIASIIELGAGFHPELTGRENIFVHGSMMGITNRVLRQKLDQIVDFAELSEFIDSPIRTYSTGMIARLGFAIAIDVSPDILIVDEVLSVGDEAFQEKCGAKMKQLRRAGVTILYVTHALNTLPELCDRVILIEHGQLKAEGAPDRVIDLYRHGLEPISV